MQAGDLHTLLAFDERAAVDDNHGNVDEEFDEQFQLWANVRPQFRGEAVFAARLEGRTLVNITVRDDEDSRTIKPDWRARNVETGVIYNLLGAIDPFEHDVRRGEWIELLADAGTKQA